MEFIQEEPNYFNEGEQRSYDVHCRLCHQLRGDSPVISSGPLTYLLRVTQNALHLSSNDINLIYRTYIKEHTDIAHHGTKPFRLHCSKCTNQLGVVMKESVLYPSFHQDSIIFVKGKEIMDVMNWKKLYATNNKKIRATPIGAWVEERFSPLVFQPIWDKKFLKPVRIQKDFMGSETKYTWEHLPKGSYASRIVGDPSKDVQKAIYPVENSGSRKYKMYTRKEIENLRNEQAHDDWPAIKKLPKKVPRGKPVVYDMLAWRKPESTPFSRGYSTFDYTVPLDNKFTRITTNVSEYKKGQKLSEDVY